MATQCLRIGKARTGKPAYCANVALKINVKLRGTNTILAPPQLKGVNIASVPTIVFGGAYSPWQYELYADFPPAHLQPMSLIPGRLEIYKLLS